MYEISATLTVTDVNEPPVFETLPKPYLATIRTNPGAGYNIITLVAKDPEGARIHYEKTSGMSVLVLWRCWLQPHQTGTLRP